MKSNIEGSTFITTEEFARFGLTVHLGTEEPHRVISKTEAMYIPARSTTADPSVVEDYNVGDNGNFISFYDSFRYLGTQISPDLNKSVDASIGAASFFEREESLNDNNIPPVSLFQLP
jgi:hypothetical protein